MKQLLAAVTLSLVAALGLAEGGAADESPPGRAVYSDPGPLPPPDTVAKEFVDRSAPSLKGVTAEQLARGVVVEEEKPPGRASEPVSRPAGDGRPTIVAVAPIDDPRLLDRAGVAEHDRSLDTLLGAVLAGVLALAGLALLSSRSRQLGTQGSAL